MPNKKWIVNLTASEQERLQTLIKQGRVAGRKLNRAHILLLADEGQADSAIAAALHSSVSTVERTRQRCVDGGVEYALTEAVRPKRGTKLDAKGRAPCLAFDRGLRLQRQLAMTRLGTIAGAQRRSLGHAPA